MSVKITNLTALNVLALLDAFPQGESLGTKITTTATTATFDCDAERAALLVGGAIIRLGGREHPGRSLWAVKRKLERAGKEQE